ncbi:hypothetical protein HDU76_009154 [Blyttiomyces sp. JEL0837]|nr:hypothetical protein HDU76_009154 [Blyttiomyces sp. JEL0837]
MDSYYKQLQSGAANEQEEYGNWTENITHLKQKGREYDERYAKESLSLNSIAQEYRLDHLKEMNASVNELFREVQSQEKELAAYRDLPPDLTLARVKVEQKKLELKELMRKKQAALARIAGTN